MDNKKKKKKKALLVALTYLDDPDRTLKGAHLGSVGPLRRLLMKEFKFDQKDITLITDAFGKTPTDKEIIVQLLKLIANAEPGDIFLFYYGGHGGRRKSTKYNNNSGFVEFLSLGKDAMGVKTYIVDHTLRQIVETLPHGCLITIIADCCHSGALLEGATEIIGESTRFSVTDKIPAPMSEHLDLKPVDPLNCHRVGVLLSACQSYETAGSKYCDVRKKHTAYFTDTLISTINNLGVNISNQVLVEEIKKVFDKDKRKQSPGLYCDISQASLKFLSLEEAEITQLPEDGGEQGSLPYICEDAINSVQTEYCRTANG